MLMSFRPVNVIQPAVPTAVPAHRAGEQMWTSERWIGYFRRNRTRLMEVPWDRGVVFSPAERAAVVDSLREFQLGESGEGNYFRSLARKWAARSGDLAYVEAQDLFLAEEHRHSRDLGRVLDLAGEPRATELKVDNAFRVLRKLAGLELAIVMLVSAEMVAQVYYPCLGRATESPVLRTLCRQICRDEAQHIRFQCQRLAILRQNKWRLRNALATFAQRCLLILISQILWPKHGPTLRRGGLTRWTFARSLMSKFNVAARLSDPRTYAQRVPGRRDCECLQSCGGTDKTCTLR